MTIPKDSGLTKPAQKLRIFATKEENHLWYDYLRKQKIPFKRQKVIGEYIVDFWCERVRLVIELDGSQHGKPENRIKDGIRTAYLNSLDITVLRFTNDDIHKNFIGVCYEIEKTINRLL